MLFEVHIQKTFKKCNFFLGGYGQIRGYYSSVFHSSYLLAQNLNRIKFYRNRVKKIQCLSFSQKTV